MHPVVARGNHKRKLLMQLFNSYSGWKMLCWSCVCKLAKSLHSFEEWRLLVQARDCFSPSLKFARVREMAVGAGKIYSCEEKCCAGGIENVGQLDAFCNCGGHIK